MPGPDEIRRQQTPLSPAMQEFLASILKLPFDPVAMRRKLAERFQEYMENPPHNNHLYQKDTIP